VLSNVVVAVLSWGPTTKLFYIIYSSSYVALQLFVQTFGLLNQFFPTSSILGKSLPVWYF
jgi:hypothetical protein